MHRLLLAKIAQSTELPNMDGTAEYGRGHDGSPQDGYRGTKGYWVSRILPAGAPWSDLLLANGRAWARPLYTLSKCYLPLYEKLREDRLISDDLDTVLSNLPSKLQLFRRRNYFYTLNDTFVFDFSHDALIFFVITEQGVERLMLKQPFTDRRKTSEGIVGRPYTGAYKMTSLGTPMFIILMYL